MKRQVTVLLVAATIFWANTARADFDLKTFRLLQEHAAAKEKLSDYVTGVGRGIFWANAMVENRSGQGLFCMPGKLSLDQGLIQSLLDQEIRSPANGTPYPDDTPIELILLRAFQTRFPCE